MIVPLLVPAPSSARVSASNFTHPSSPRAKKARAVRCNFIDSKYASIKRMNCLAQLHRVIYSREARECRVRRWDLRFNVFTIGSKKQKAT